MKKKVLLIGDSIRLGYQEQVRALLGNGVEVYAPEENCRYAKYALWGMHRWVDSFGNPKFDAVHFNAGIWDLHRCTADGEIFTPIREYADTIRRLGLQMKSYTENVIYANTIPANRKLDDSLNAFNPFINTAPGYKKVHLTVGMEEWNGDVRRYNAAAGTEMEKLHIPVNDLYSPIAVDTDRYISTDGIHASAEGYQLLAKLVAQRIKEIL